MMGKKVVFYQLGKCEPHLTQIIKFSTEFSTSAMRCPTENVSPIRSSKKKKVERVEKILRKEGDIKGLWAEGQRQSNPKM